MKAKLASVKWDENGLPYSLNFDDYYFSKLNGLDESRYVFIEQNQLEQKFSLLKNGELFIIGETGFGTGLNFLTTLQLWNTLQKKHANPGRLHFISVEQYPLAKADLAKALALWPELSQLSHQLLEQYPEDIQKTTYQLQFNNSQVSLSLIINDAQEGLSQLLASRHPYFQHPQWHGVNTWFLDGFTPTKNISLWQEKLLATISQLSKTGASVSTFSAASVINKGLSKAGFTVQKKPGFGKKRELITAIKHTPIATASLPHLGHSSPYPAPWSIINGYQPLSPRSEIAVIGAGLAGCHTARALADAGYQVTLLEACAQICQKGSGNVQAVLYAKLSADQQSLSQFNYHSLAFAQRHYQPYWLNKKSNTDPEKHFIGEQCGVLQLAWSNALEQSHKRINEQYSSSFVTQVTPEQASAIAGITLNYPGLYFPNSGWLNPPNLCHALIDHPNITLKINTDVKQLSYNNGLWKIECQQTQYLAASVVICSAVDATLLAQTCWLPTQAVRGQVSQAAQADSATLNTVVCAKGYIGPSYQDNHYFGATYTPKNNSLETSLDDHQKNLEHLKMISSEIANTMVSNEQNLKGHMEGNAENNLENNNYGRVGFRCTTKDYLPIVGPVPYLKDTENTYHLLAKNAKSRIDCANRYHPHLYINVGHGSRGLSYTPISANLITSIISGSPPLLPMELREALNPTRFIIRALIKGKAMK